MKLCFLSLILLSIPLFAGDAQRGRDGRLYDPGVTMTKRADNAPPEMDKLASMVGQWNVKWQVPAGEGQIATATAYASITWMNRGFGLMERLHIPDNGKGVSRDLMAFYTYHPATSAYGMGLADNFTSSIKIYTGKADEAGITLHSAIRPQGNMRFRMEKFLLEISSKDEFVLSLKVSEDYGTNWNLVQKRTYTRRELSPEFMKLSTDNGAPVGERSTDGKAFDFLIGEWDAYQDIKLPNGQNAKFPSNSTAVYALGGHGILEFNWYDVDPQLPNCATTILRLYNPAMLRWESLYVTNRGNGLLHFGGNKEGDKVILHNFETDMSAANVPFYIFHTIEKDQYLWESKSTPDRGKTWNTTWKIITTRKKE